MSREQNPRKKPIKSARRDKAKGHQARRTRGGKETEEKIAHAFLFQGSGADEEVLITKESRNAR